jgi:hypothetical protein
MLLELLFGASQETGKYKRQGFVHQLIITNR